MNSLVENWKLDVFLDTWLVKSWRLLWVLSRRCVYFSEVNWALNFGREFDHQKSFVFFQVGFIPCKFEQKLQGMESKEKEKDEKHTEKLFRKNPKNSTALLCEKTKCWHRHPYNIWEEWQKLMQPIRITNVPNATN